jgi:hypothetical protein
MEMHCIACALETSDGLTCIHIEVFNLPPLSSLWLLRLLFRWPKVPRRNLVHHVCCSHVITTRGALGILVGSMRLTANPCASLYATPLLRANCMGKQVMLTSITSIISHEHVHFSLCIMASASYAHMHKHHVLICMCITLYAPQHEH